MKKYIEDLRQALKRKNMSDETIEEIIQDHEDMIETALNEGLALGEIESKFGDPVKVAEELVEQSWQDASLEFDQWKVHSTYDLEGKPLSIDVHLVNEEITYRISKKKELVLKYASKQALKEYDIDLKDGRFTLRAPAKKMLSFISSNHVEFVLEIPESVVLDVLSHKGVNGDSDYRGLNLERLIVDTTNGNLSLQALQANQITIHSVNGDLSLASCSAKKLALSSISGDAVLTETDVFDRFKWHAVSGDLELESLTCDQCLLEVVSGDIKGKEFYPKSLSFKSVSGDLDVYNLKEFSHASWKTKSLSGAVSFH